jgi:hypothetical protein
LAAQTYLPGGAEWLSASHNPRLKLDHTNILALISQVVGGHGLLDHADYTGIDSERLLQIYKSAHPHG